MHLVAGRDAHQNLDRVFGGRLGHVDRREPAGERGIPLDVLAVLDVRRCPNAGKLSSRQRCFELVRQVVGRFASDEECVNFIDEQDDLSIGPLDLELQTVNALRERTSNPGTRNQASGGKLDQDRAFETAYAFSASGEPPGEAFDDRRLSHAGRADQNRIVGSPAGQNVQEALDFVVATDHLVDPSEGSHLRQVAPELGQCRILARVEGERRRRRNDELVFRLCTRACDRSADRRFDQNLVLLFVERLDA